jgi:hypothetical protein
MSRTETVDAIMLQHMGWREDSLVIQEQGHKGDQTGEAKYWKHVYANPGNPEVCPVLALALVVFSGPARDTLGKQQIFLGSNNKDRFAKTLHQIIRALPEPELQLLGGERADIGPYSLRKGSASYCLGQVSGPNPVTVQLRMGHSLGKVNDAYFFVGDGQDQLCGRMIAGLPFNDEGFAALPPHFCTEVVGLYTILIYIYTNTYITNTYPSAGCSPIFTHTGARPEQTGSCSKTAGKHNRQVSGAARGRGRTTALTCWGRCDPPPGHAFE